MLERYRFLVSARWLGLTAAAICGVVVCAMLSQWQWDRAEMHAEANARIEAADDSAPLDEVLAAGAALDEDDRWALVEATGTFDTANEIVLRARTNDGVNGYGIVTPLILDDGTALLVNRGFIARDDSGSVPAYPAAPTGEVTVVGRIYESESESGAVTERDGRLLSRRLNLDQIDAHLDYELRGAWIGALEPSDGLEPIQTPSFDAWQNYSYAVQWALFAAMMPVGWVVLVRRELREDGDPDDDEPDGGEADGDEPVSPRTGSPSTAA